MKIKDLTIQLLLIFVTLTITRSFYIEYRNSLEFYYTKNEVLKLNTCNNLSKEAENGYDKRLLSLIDNSEFICDNTTKYIEYYNKNNSNIDDTIYLINNNITYEYDKNLVSILSDKNYNSKYLDNYIKYLKENNIIVSEGIKKVNEQNKPKIETNKNSTDLIAADLSKSLFILVNKKYYVPEDYVPNNLIAISAEYTKSGKGKLVKEAKDAFETMCNAALLDNIKLYNVSAYRSYSAQVANWNHYVKRDGEAKASTYSAYPGRSEHHTGLAIDINQPNDGFVKTEEYKWLKENSYKYGFILRYPEGKQSITGYKFEPWHYRYLGIDMALKVYNSGLTYDEYYELYIKD